MQSLKTTIKNLGRVGVLCLFAGSIFAEPSVSLDLSDVHFLKDKSGKIRPTAYLGQSFQLKVVVSGEKSAPKDFDVAGLNQFMVSKTSHHSNISVNNSSMLIEKSTEYTLLPKKLGTFFIGPSTVNIDGKTYKSNRVVIDVVQPSEKISISKTKEPKFTGGSESQVICSLQADKKSAFLEEPILLTIYIHYSDDANLRELSPPQFVNFTVKELGKIKKYREKRGTASHEGTAFRENDMILNVVKKQYLIFPNKPGTQIITPARATYLAQDRRRNRFFDEGFFSNFFDVGGKQKVASSNQLEIEVKNLPSYDQESQGAAFHEGVGTFDYFVAKVDKKKVALNEPITFVIELQGNTNSDLILKPELSLEKVFKIYDSKIETHQNGVTAKKSFEFILQIPEPGKFTIKPQKFVYFDTEEKKYKTLETKPISIEVEGRGPTSTQSTILVQEPEENEPKREPRPENNDIHFIEEDVYATDF
jgi:hypothetical protein